MISLEEAQARVLKSCRPAEPTVVARQDALGCVLAEPIVATEAIPPFANSSMDGYAVRAADTAGAPISLELVGEVRAGQGSLRSLGPGEAIRIMTGAPMPDGADAVVMVEETELDGNWVRIRQSVTTGTFVRTVGEDVQPGDLVLAPGIELAPMHLGVLAACNVARLRVYPRLTVGVISSGDELVTDGSPLGPGQIREANGELLLGLLAHTNCQPVDLGVVADDEAALSAALLDGGRRCDALLTSGGVSMGDYDYVKVVLDKLGEMQWMQIAIRPAKPFAFGMLHIEERSIPVFGLPGNPVSSMVSFELLARPGLRALMGHEVLVRDFVPAIADARFGRTVGDERVHYDRVVAYFADDGRLHVWRTGQQGSHQLANSASANALARIPVGEGIEEGDEVFVSLLGQAHAGTSQRSKTVDRATVGSPRQ